MSAHALPDGSRSLKGACRFEILEGVSSLGQRYDGFLLDQWGVLHDGANAYPGAIEALSALREAGKKIVILSNSGRRGSENETLLARMGFARSLYDVIVSAGDDARDAILKGEFDFEPGARCFLLSRDGENHLADGLGLEITGDIREADFIFNLSMDPPHQSVAGWMPTLAEAAKRGLLMICGNPDYVRVAPDGTLLEAPGAVARAYEKLGGTVAYHGKPYRRIYQTCLEIMHLPKHQVIAIGDSLDHDVTGARHCGIDSALVAGGIHHGEFAWDAGTPQAESCSRLFETAAISPDFVVPAFRW